MAEISAKKRIWGWWWFDWASQPYHTLLVTFVFGPFFATVAAAWFLGDRARRTDGRCRGAGAVVARRSRSPG